MGYGRKNPATIKIDNPNVAELESQLAQNVKYRKNIVVDITEAPFNAKCDGVTDDTQSLKDAISFVSNLRVGNLQGGDILIPGKCRVIDNIVLGESIKLIGHNTLHDGSIAYNASAIILDHINEGITLNKQGIVLQGLWITRKQTVTSTVKDIRVNTSYSTIKDCNVNPNGGIGIYYDGTNACYFNELNNCILNGSGKMVVYNGANCTTNRAIGGLIASATTGGLYIENEATTNTFISVDFEGTNNGTAITLMTGENSFISCHIEENLINVHLGAGNNTFINSQIVAHEGQTAFTGDWKHHTRFMQRQNIDGTYETFLAIPGFKLGYDGGTSYLDREIVNATDGAGLRFFNKTPSTGIKYLEAYNYNGTSYNKFWGVTTHAQEGFIVESLGEIKLMKCAPNPNGVSYTESEPGSLAYRRGYGHKYAGDSWFGELYLKTQNTDNTGYKEIQAIHSGTTAQRVPVPSSIGFQYFDTTLGKPIWVKSLNPTVWVDAMGTTV
jgi:hypothetical protein